MNQELRIKHEKNKFILQVYLKHIQQFYSKLNINMKYSYEEESECDYPNHNCELLNIQSQWVNTSYDNFLTQIENAHFKGTT